MEVKTTLKHTGQEFFLQGQDGVNKLKKLLLAETSSHKQGLNGFGVKQLRLSK